MIDAPMSPVEPISAEGWTERLYEVSLAMLCVTGFDGYFKTVNPAWVATLGHSVEELLAVPAAEFVHPDDQAFTLLESVAAAAGNNAAQFRNRYRHRDGSYRWLDWLAITDPARKLIFASARDITVEKETEAARVKVQNVLDAVYRSITDHAIYMIDPGGTILTWSPGAESVKGWRAEEVVGKPFAMFYSAEEIAAERPRRDLEHALTQGSHRSEGWRKRRDGGSIWTEVTTSPVHGAEGELLGFVNVVHDLSESHRLQLEMTSFNETLEARIARRTADLTSAVSELESFAYTVSHDLRAPLRAMDGFSRILLEDQAHLLSETAQRQLVRVRENAQQMGKLIDELLRFSRINRGPMERKEVDPGAIARQVAGDLYSESERPLPITVEPMPACLAEPTLLRQIYANLIGNALKFSRDVKVPEIVIGCDTTQIPPAYFVKDNGVGFDMQYAGRLFGVFQRLHRAEDFEGTGVGLATVQRIVQRHGGRVWAESQPNLGATFHFTLEDPDVKLR
jgi:PAS domain S-box-containing protein